MTSTAAKHPDDEHDWLSAGYVEEWVGEWADRPDRPAELRRVAAAIPLERSVPCRVLDLGGGWGPLTAEVLSFRPRSTVMLVDYSPPMLDHARRRLAPFGDRVRFELRDLTDPSWSADLDGPYDAVVSSLAIHNLRDPAAVRAVYVNILDLLSPGHWFFNLEVAFPDGPGAGHLVERLRAYEKGTDPDVGDAGALAGSADPDADDSGHPPLSVGRQLDLLRDAGFREVDCLWRTGWTALLAARAG